LKGVDYLVLGEGEEVFKNLLDHIDNKNDLKNIAGLVFKENSAIIYTGMPPHIENLDGLPFPARNLVPYKKYTSLLSKGENFTTIFTSRGCPFRCSFCARPHLGKRFRARSADNVVDELEECVEMGINEFLFYDDTFTVQKKRVLDICNEITKRKLDIGWDIRARVDTVDEEIIKHLKKAGCKGIHYGVESGSDKVLKALKKDINLEQVAQTFKLTRKYDIPILAYFMIGNPSETRDDIDKTFELMRKLKPDYVHLTIFIPFPGTQIYANGLKSGLIKEDYWRAFAMNPSPSFVAPFWDEVFNRDEMEELLGEGYRKFYFRTSQLVKMAMKIRSVGELYKKAKAGAAVFQMKH
ncbi:MAG: B12-binding domain-containing radical SAM protein, partial [Mobilitalea sp.]